MGLEASKLFLNNFIINSHSFRWEDDAKVEMLQRG